MKSLPLILSLGLAATPVLRAARGQAKTAILTERASLERGTPVPLL